MSKAVPAASSPSGAGTLEAMASALRENQPDETELDVLVRRVLVAMIEERGTRQPGPRSTPIPTRSTSCAG
jgi:hypothetical protein